MGHNVVVEGLRSDHLLGILEGRANKPICLLDSTWKMRNRRVKNFG